MDDVVTTELSLAQATLPSEISAALMSARLTEFEQECAPFRFALSTRAGTDCVGHVVRASTDAYHRLTILSVDGIGAYDHVLRPSMLIEKKCLEHGQLLPFVRLSYAGVSSYTWFDEKGERRVVDQAEAASRETH